MVVIYCIRLLVVFVYIRKYVCLGLGRATFNGEILQHIAGLTIGRWPQRVGKESMGIHQFSPVYIDIRVQVVN